ncbi:hypothetical protein V8C43DRAFT_283184 [Trichoderma afarasin]
MASAKSSIPSILLNVLCFILFVGPLFECIVLCTVLAFLLRAGLRPTCSYGMTTRRHLGCVRKAARLRRKRIQYDSTSTGLDSSAHTAHGTERQEILPACIELQSVPRSARRRPNNIH